MDTILKVENLTKSYPGGFKLQGLDFHLERGYVMGFIGANGAGKTTTIKLMMDLITRDDGVVEIFGLDPRVDGVSIRQRIGFVYDELNVHGKLTGREVKSFVAPHYRAWDEKLFRRHARDFELDLTKPVATLSRGQKIKLFLALALSHNAELIIMDEPTSGLDPVFRAELLDLLYTVIQDEQKSVFFSTHITSDLEKIADFITFIHNGRLIFSDSKDGVMERFRIVKGPARAFTPELRSLCISGRETAVGFEALTEKPDAVTRLIGSRAVVERASLDDIMVHTVRRDSNE